MSDKLVRAIAADATVRAFAAISTDVVEEARKRHDSFPVATAALGRALTAALLLGATLKENENITLRIAGDGPLGGIIVDTDGAGNVRGYVRNAQFHLPAKNGKLDVGGAVGAGFLYITRDAGLKEPYTGSTPLVSGEIGEDITHYLYTSEQTPSTVALGVLVNPDYSVQAAGGFIVQAMPNVTEETLDILEENLKKLPPVSSLVSIGKSPEDILALIFEGLPMQTLSEEPVCYCCRCSRERLSSVFKSLGEQELQEMIEEGQAEARCHFCNEVYHFSREDLAALIDQTAQ
jgi:molecular chaperone Hsp33